MKKIIAMMILIPLGMLAAFGLIISCVSKPKEKEELSTIIINGSTYEYKNSIKYIKGKKTHLCFAKIDNGAIDPTSGIITCVPCDSLKNVNVEEVEGI